MYAHTHTHTHSHTHTHPHTHTHVHACAPLAPPQIKNTVLLMPNGSDKVTSAPQQPVETDKKVEDPELLKLLNTGARRSDVKDVEKEAILAPLAASLAFASCFACFQRRGWPAFGSWGCLLPWALARARLQGPQEVAPMEAKGNPRPCYVSHLRAQHRPLLGHRRQPSAPNPPGWYVTGRLPPPYLRLPPGLKTNKKKKKAATEDKAEGQ